MRWLWGSVLLRSLFWLNTVYIFTPPWANSLWLVIAAVLLAGAALRSVAVKRVSPLWLIGVVPIGIAVFWIAVALTFTALLQWFAGGWLEKVNPPGWEMGERAKKKKK